MAGVSLVMNPTGCRSSLFIVFGILLCVSRVFGVKCGIGCHSECVQAATMTAICCNKPAL